MFLDHPRRPAHSLLAHVGRQRFVYLSLVLHALPLGALGYWEHADSKRVQGQRHERLIESGKRQTQQARLEKRVKDMEQIKSLLEKSTDGGNASSARADEDKQSDLQSSAQPKGPADLLKDARELSRTIETIERDIKAEALAKLLDIPKEKALEQLAERPLQDEAPIPPKSPEEAAAQIAQLETKAREVLERRRQQLEQRHNGSAVTADVAPGSSMAKPAGSGQHDASERSAQTQGAAAGGPRSGGSGSRNPQNGDGDANGAGSGTAGTGDGIGYTGGAQKSSALERITAFTNPDLPDLQTTEYAAGGVRDYYDNGVGNIPGVDSKQLVKRSGRMIGPGGAYANRIYINRWYVIGPFEGKPAAGLISNARHPPEDAVVLDASYRGKDGRLLRWEYLEATKYPLMPPKQAENAVYYGYTELMLDKDQDLRIWVGADDDAQLWLNDKLAWKGGNVNKQWFFDHVYQTKNTHVRDYNLSEGTRVVRFKKGRNKLFFKLSNGPTRLFFSLVLTK